MIVADAGRLAITTATGPVDPLAPFQAFPAPMTGLVIDHPLLHERRLARIQLDLDWLGFPPRGLRDYYRGYRFDPPIRNASFTVGITAPLAGWAEGQARRLFSANGVSRFDLVARGRGEALKGPIRLQLSAPAEGFGEQGYAEAVMAASLRNPGGRPGKLPNPPWRPMIARIALRVLPA